MNAPAAVLPNPIPGLDAVKTYIEKRTGIVCDKKNDYLLENKLKPLLAELKCPDYGHLIAVLTGPDGKAATARMLDAITVNETLWFRDRGPFQVLERLILPALGKAAVARGGKINIWCAASSTGQEPYSVAMTVDAYLTGGNAGGLTWGNIDILATDLSPRVLHIAQQGSYDAFSMSRGMAGNERFAKHFRKVQNASVLSEHIRGKVRLQELNLVEDFSSLGIFDVILCRNVAIYLGQERKVALYERLKRALRPTGYLFLGASETLSVSYSGFQYRDFEGHIYYTPK